MPKSTFFNLPEEKRQRIINVALDEFGDRKFNEASLTRIVERAGIAKGSMYQYFEDKFDLYLYLMGLGAETKIKRITEALDSLGPEADIFDKLRAAARAGFKMARDHPRLAGLANNLLQERPEFMARVIAHFGPLGDDFYGQWFQQAKELGQVDERINPSTVKSMFESLFQAQASSMVGRLTDESVIALVDEWMWIMEHGVRPQNRKGEKEVEGR